LSIKEYKEHQELKKELLRNNEKLKEKAALLKEMESKYDEREVQLNTISKYHVLVDEFTENVFYRGKM
jgi:hypothetical protein